MSVDASAAGGRSAGSQTMQRLRKGQLSLPNCIALSAAVMAPVIAVILNAPAAGPNAQGGLPLSFLAAFIATLFLANTVIQFARRLPCSGLYYNYCSHALGGGAGFYIGWLYFGAFILFAIGLFTANGAFLQNYMQTEWSVNVNWWILSLILMGLVFILSLRSIKASVRVDLSLLAFEMVVLRCWGSSRSPRRGTGTRCTTLRPAPHRKGSPALGSVLCSGSSRSSASSRPPCSARRAGTRAVTFLARCWAPPSSSGCFTCS
jgi:Amino acid permease